MAIQTGPSKNSPKKAAGRAAPAPGPGPARGQTEAAASRQSTPDAVYGVVSVLYHALQGEEAYGQYIRDAQTAGDDKLARFFTECRAEEQSRARRAKSLLLDRLEGEAGEDDEDEDEDDDEGDEGDEDDEDDEDEDDEED